MVEYISKPSTNKLNPIDSKVIFDTCSIVIILVVTNGLKYHGARHWTPLVELSAKISETLVLG